MPQFGSFVFLDEETTSLQGHRPVKIVEISLIACSREHLLATEEGELPRVLHKLTLCVKPFQEIHESVAKEINNVMVQGESKFDENTVKLLTLFLQRLQSPICLIAHSGNTYDFPILKETLQGLKAELPVEETYCFDPLPMFRQLPRAAPSPEQAAQEKKPFRLGLLYERLLGEPHEGSHKAERDAEALFKCVTVVKDDFVNYAERDCIKFKDFSGTYDI